MSPEGLSSRSIDQDAATETGLAAIHIGKSYRKRRVVRDVSLTLQRGEIVGLLGPNGAGKTTCFYMITGLVRVDQGQITIDGADVTGLPMYQRARLGVGYLPQEPSIFRGLTVEQNVMAIVELVEKDAKERQNAVDRLLAELHIDHLRDSPASALSGGERRRVEIARALATRPSYMLLDEPFAGIDPIAINDIRELVQFLKNRGIGILITDHNVRETLGIVDRGYIMFDGEVLFSGTPQQILSNPEVRKVYLGDTFQPA
jgi:lipopolysaccharide export system ATP-binding protein